MYHIFLIFDFYLTMSILAPIIFIFFFLLVIALLGFSIVLNGILGLWYGFIRRFFGGSPMASGENSRRRTYWNGRSSGNENQDEGEGKIFSSDEGTYVDFEEVK